MAISDKLQDLIDIKQDIKEAIENKGIDLTGKTWLLNGNINQEMIVDFDVSFISNNQVFEHLAAATIMGQFQAFYGNTLVYINFSWSNEAYQTITFETAPTGDLLTWLEANAVKQTAGVGFGGYAEKIDEIPLPKEEQEVTVDGFIFQSGDVVVTPSTGKVMTKVTVVKDNNLVPENIVKDVNIFGVVGTVETVVELTQAQYDALSVYDNNTYYLIVED